jgi:spore germination protein
MNSYISNIRRSNLAKELWCLFALFLASGLVFAQKKDTIVFPLDSKTDTFDFSIGRYYAKNSMVSDHKQLFERIHGKKIKVQATGVKSYSELKYDTTTNDFFGKLLNKQVLRKDCEVFGWHPYWMEEQSKHYPYSLMSTVAFFSYDVNEYDGTYYDPLAINNWRTTTMIDSAHKNNAKVLLTVTSYGKERNNILLKNRYSWATLGDSLNKLLLDRKAQGIDIDFTGITKNNRQIFCEFMNTLRAKIGDASMITMHITSRDLRDGVFDLFKLKNGPSKVSLFVVQGYDYEEVSVYKRAMAPLFSTLHDEPCIVHTVSLCLKNGLLEKDLILNLPLYGTKWDGKQTIELPYEDIVSMYEVNKKGGLEFGTLSAYLKSDEDASIIWYESSVSIYRKFAWAKESKLGGVGLWGLGYDGGRAEVWQTVIDNFGADSYQLIENVSIDNGYIYSLMSSIQKYRKIIGVALLIIFSFYMIGLLLSLLDWRVREIFFRRYMYRALLSIIALLIIVVFLIFEVTSTEGYVIHLLIGAVIGGIIVFLITKNNIKERKKMP